MAPMKSVFIGGGNLKLFQAYTREDVGYKGTQRAEMRGNNNKNERVAFFNLGHTYDNRLTKNGVFLDPRGGTYRQRSLDELNQSTTYLFLRNGNRGPYYYVGTSQKAAPHKKQPYIWFDVNVKGVPLNKAAIPTAVLTSLGGFQQIP